LLLCAGALVAFALWAAPAQAIKWVPESTAITGSSINTKMEYGGVQTTICNSELKGTTPAAGATMPLTSWIFNECENPTGGFTASMSVSVGKIPFSVVATKESEAHIEIPKEGSLKVTLRNFLVDWCVYTAEGPQVLTGTFSNATHVLTLTGKANFKRTGWGSAETCGENEEEEAPFVGFWGMSEKLEIK
jgi:hypothetical protein